MSSTSAGERPIAAGVRAEADTLLVRDVMTRHPMVLTTDVPVHIAAGLLHDLRISSAPVVTPAGELVGVLGQRELLDSMLMPAIAAQDPMAVRRWWSLTAGRVCSRPPHVTRPDADVAEAARIMLRHEVGRLVVVEDDEVVGMVSQRDLLPTLLESPDTVIVVGDDAT